MVFSLILSAIVGVSVYLFMSNFELTVEVKEKTSTDPNALPCIAKMKSGGVRATLCATPLT